MRSKLAPTGHTFICFNRPLSYPKWLPLNNDIQVQLLGGYAAGRITIVIFRFPSYEDEPERDASLQLLAGGLGRTVHTDERALDVDSEDYDHFADLPVGSRFRLGGKMWTKLDPDALAKKIGDRVNLQ